MPYIIFAKWFGFISVALALGILFNLGDARRMAKHMIHSDSGYILGGVLPIIFGSLALVDHASFQFDWEMVVTLISLFMVLIGLFRVLFVTLWMTLLERYTEQIPVLFSLFGLMFGLLLLYVGYIAPLVSYGH